MKTLLSILHNLLKYPALCPIIQSKTKPQAVLPGSGCPKTGELPPNRISDIPVNIPEVLINKTGGYWKCLVTD